LGELTDKGRGTADRFQYCQVAKIQSGRRVVIEIAANFAISLGANDEARTARALKGVVGKRLTYRNSHVTTAG
jgi:hypothetical protein